MSIEASRFTPEMTNRTYTIKDLMDVYYASAQIERDAFVKAATTSMAEQEYTSFSQWINKNYDSLSPAE